jgi:hypothetical protein
MAQECMDRETLEPIAREMMVKASKNLKNDGFVAFVVILHLTVMEPKVGA